MLHPTTPYNSTYNSANSEARFSLFLNLPREIHFKIGGLLDPQALSNIIQSCRQCQADYDTVANFIPFLKPEFKDLVPKKLSKETFAFEARKKYDIIFEHSQQLLKEPFFDYLLINNIVNEDDVPFYSRSELVNFYYRVQHRHVGDLIKTGRLSIEMAKNLSKCQFERLCNYNIYLLFANDILSSQHITCLTDNQVKNLQSTSISCLLRDNKLSLEDIEDLTSNQIERLKYTNIYKLFHRGKLSLKNIECLTDHQVRNLEERSIYLLFESNKLSLEGIEDLTSDQLEKLSKHNIYRLISNNKLSLSTINSLRIDQLEKLCFDCIATWIENDTLSLEDLETISAEQAERINQVLLFLLMCSSISERDVISVTKNQINGLCKPNIPLLLKEKRLSLNDVEKLSEKQVDRLSNYNVYRLFGKGILSLQEIENFPDDQALDPSIRSFFFLMKTKANSYWNFLWTFWNNQSN